MAVLIATCKDNKSFEDILQIGKEYEVIEHYYCKYDEIERVIIECDDKSRRDFYAKNFSISSKF